MPPATPMIGTQTLHPNNEQHGFPTPKYSTAVQDYIKFRRMRMIAARDVRDAPRDEFDGMPFLMYMDMLKKHDDQYITPRKNKIDTSINLGSIRDKDTTLVQYAMKFDFMPVAQCFDDNDDVMEEMAEVSSDLVHKSLLLENDKEKQKLVVRSMITFGTAFVEDFWLERWEHEKIVAPSHIDGQHIADWSDKIVKTYAGCQSKLWDIRKCYLGDIRKFFMNGPQGQPFFFTVEYEQYDVVKGIFGDWDMWKYVPTTVVFTPEVSQPMNYTSAWTLRPVTINYCELIRYYDPIANEYAIMINGIDMLPIQEKKTKVNGIEKTLISGFPLTAISPSGMIPFAKYDNEPMHDFAYSKATPGKMRVLADVENMLMKLYLTMVKQKAKPTLGNKSGRNLDQEIYDAGGIINDLRDGDLFPVLPNYQGMMPADFSFFELVKKEIDKNSMERSFQGRNPTTADKTATQELDEMKAASLQVASMLDGLISGRCQLFALRNYNIARNWTKPLSKEVDAINKVVIDKYRTVTLPTEIEGGQKATKKIIFTKDTPKGPKGKVPLKASQKIHQQEIDTQKETGKETRIALLHPELYANMKMSWYWTCIPVPNGSDPMSYMVFAKQITDATSFFGPQSMNVKKLKHKFAAMTGQDFDTWFKSEQELQQEQQQQQQQQEMQPNSATAPGASTKSMLANTQPPNMSGVLGR